MQVRILSLLSSAKIKSWQYSLIGESSCLTSRLLMVRVRLLPQKQRSLIAKTLWSIPSHAGANPVVVVFC